MALDERLIPVETFEGETLMPYPRRGQKVKSEQGKGIKKIAGTTVVSVSAVVKAMGDANKSESLNKIKVRKTIHQIQLRRAK